MALHGSGVRSRRATTSSSAKALERLLLPAPAAAWAATPAGCRRPRRGTAFPSAPARTGRPSARIAMPADCKRQQEIQEFECRFTVRKRAYRNACTQPPFLAGHGLVLWSRTWPCARRTDTPTHFRRESSACPAPLRRAPGSVPRPAISHPPRATVGYTSPASAGFVRGTAVAGDHRGDSRDSPADCRLARATGRPERDWHRSLWSTASALPTSCLWTPRRCCTRATLASRPLAVIMLAADTDSACVTPTSIGPLRCDFAKEEKCEVVFQGKRPSAPQLRGAALRRFPMLARLRLQKSALVCTQEIGVQLPGGPLRPHAAG